MDFKTKIHTTCRHLLDEKIQSLNSILVDLKDGITNDSKSSAGDKHETSRAMAQLEIEKISKQLYEANLQKELLQKIDLNLKSHVVIKGSVIETDNAIFYLSIALGKITVDDKTVIVLSPQSPLGKNLLGLRINDSVTASVTNYRIRNVF